MELVVVAISGVQRFISESRSTADLFAGSALMSELAAAMLEAVPDPDMLVLPAKRPDNAAGMPNRVVVLAGAGTGADLAAAMADRVQIAWRERLKAALSGVGVEPQETPGFPAVQWLVAPLGADSYQDGWVRAQAALRARKRIRDFPGYHIPQAGICSLTGRWPSVSAQASRGASAVRRGEAISAVGEVKRWYGRRHGGRFQSTWSIATAPYRDAIIRRREDPAELWEAVLELNLAVEALHSAGEPEVRAALRRGTGALPGITAGHDETMRWLRQVEGSWCQPLTWDPAQLRRDHDLTADPDPALCAAGGAAAAALEQAARKAGVPPLSPYLAVLAQDADRLGERLGTFSGAGGDPAGWQRRVSDALAGIAGRQVAEIESSHLGRVVYAGGDDLLALLPVASALAAARAANALYADDAALNQLMEQPSASTAIVFFHAAWPLQSAISSARELLKEAKGRDRPGLGLATLNRGGERARVVLPWHDRRAVPTEPMLGRLQELVAAVAGPLSGRLAGSLERDRDELAELSRDWLERELTRRAVRHGIDAENAQAVGRLLASLCTGAPGRQGFTDCADSVLIARFIASQSRISA
jgi:CRISPR-associated protein